MPFIEQPRGMRAYIAHWGDQSYAEYRASFARDYRHQDTPEQVEDQAKHTVSIFVDDFATWLLQPDICMKALTTLYIPDKKAHTLATLSRLMIDHPDPYWILTDQSKRNIGDPMVNIRYGSTHKYAEIRWNLATQAPHYLGVHDTVASEPVHQTYIFLPTSSPTMIDWTKYEYNRPMGQPGSNMTYDAKEGKLTAIAHRYDAQFRPIETITETYKYISPYTTPTNQQTYVWGHLSTIHRYAPSNEIPPGFSGGLRVLTLQEEFIPIPS